MNKLNQTIINNETVKIQQLSSKLFGAETDYTISVVRLFNAETKNVHYAKISEVAATIITMIEQDYNNIATTNDSSVWY